MRRRRGSTVVMLALTLLVAVGLAACGGDDDDDAGGGTDSGEEVSGSDTIQIEYVDYAYQVSGPLNAGGTIEFTNAGKEMHMMFLGKLKAGKTLDDVNAVLESGGPDEGGEGEEGAPTSETSRASRSQGDTTTTVAEGGGEEDNPFADVLDEIGIPWNILTPGASAAVTAPNLEPGTYAMMCFFPTEGEGTAHVAKGMVNQLEVVEGDVDEPTADVTYKIAAGAAPDGPATLTAGKHTLRFEQVGDAAELEPAVGKLDPGKSFEEVDAVFDDLYEGDDPPPKGAGESIPAEVFIGGDFLVEKYFYLTMDFEPGNYVILGEDTEDEDETSPPKELLRVTVS